MREASVRQTRAGCKTDPSALDSSSETGAGDWQRRRFCCILGFAMSKRKPGKFSAAKAVKANARERVGQPKPARVIDTEPRTGRDTKHKPKLEEIIRQEE